MLKTVLRVLLHDSFSKLPLRNYVFIQRIITSKDCHQLTIRGYLFFGLNCSLIHSFSHLDFIQSLWGFLINLRFRVANLS